MLKKQKKVIKKTTQRLPDWFRVSKGKLNATKSLSKQLMAEVKAKQKLEKEEREAEKKARHAAAVREAEKKRLAAEETGLTPQIGAARVEIISTRMTACCKKYG